MDNLVQMMAIYYAERHKRYEANRLDRASRHYRNRDMNILVDDRRYLEEETLNRHWL